MESPEVVCLKKNQSVPHKVKISPHPVPKVRRDAVEFCLDPVRVAIARFSDEDILRLDSFELADLLKLSGMFSSREWRYALTSMGGDELRLTAFLARRFCRKELNNAYQRRGRQVAYANE